MVRKLYISILMLLMTLSATIALAQRDSVAKATQVLQDQSRSVENRIKTAATIIDNAFRNPETTQDGYAWYIRGYIYKEWYKNLDAKNTTSKIRLDAVEYLKKSLELFKADTANSTKEFADVARKTLKWLGATFYNDAGSLLNPNNYEAAIECYKKFDECMLLADKNYNTKPREIEFKNALASVYEKIFRNDIRAQAQFFSITEDLYKQVIVLDSNNWAANYNLAMLYYNYGVDIINNMSVTEDIIEIGNIQEDARVLFKKALPYALKAYELKPDRREVLICLQGIYFSLYEYEKSDEYKAKIILLDKGK